MCQCPGLLGRFSKFGETQAFPRRSGFSVEMTNLWAPPPSLLLWALAVFAVQPLFALLGASSLIYLTCRTALWTNFLTWCPASWHQNLQKWLKFYRIRSDRVPSYTSPFQNRSGSVPYSFKPNPCRQWKLFPLVSFLQQVEEPGLGCLLGLAPLGPPLGQDACLLPRDDLALIFASYRSTKHRPLSLSLRVSQTTPCGSHLAWWWL